jgi:spermidine synthase
MWVKQNQQKYDVVIIDFPDPSNYSLGKLYSLNFYRSLQQILTPGALIAIQTTSPYFAPKSFWCINATVKEVFNKADAYHTYVPSFGEWGFTIASNNKATNFQTINRRAAGLRFYNYQFDKLNYFAQDMISKDVEINRLDNQILVRYFDEEWGKL